MALRALALNCTLKRGDASSSTQVMLTHLLAEFSRAGIAGEIVRCANFDIHPGVTSDEGPGDAWPDVRRKILASDILVIGTPIWLGQPSSVCKRVLERLDAFISETDERKRMPSYGKLAVAAIVGNEDGAHHCVAEIFQALNDVGFTIPAGGSTYWVGEAMGSVDLADLPKIPEKVASTNRMLARSTAHLAGLLRQSAYPGVEA